MATALSALMSLAAVPLSPHPSPIEELTRLAAGTARPRPPRLLMKRDDLLTFGCGGNKVRKIQTVVAEALAQGADALVTCGSVQSNHARVTAAAGAALGLRVVLVVNGPPQPTATGNARLDALFGAEVRHVVRREDRDPAMLAAAADLRAEGRRPWIVPLGASTATGALGFARGVAEVVSAGLKPDVIIHASSSGGTQAGLIAGCALFGLKARVIGISADESSGSLSGTVGRLLDEMAARLGSRRETIDGGRQIEVDDSQVGAGYGLATPGSSLAMELTARREGILLDPVYTAKAMAGLLAMLGAGAFSAGDTVLFWHTGGQPGYFA